MGTLIEITTPDGPAEAWLTGEDGRPGVLFYVDAIGLRPRTQEMADTGVHDEAATERHFAALEALLARTL